MFIGLFWAVNYKPMFLTSYWIEVLGLDSVRPNSHILSLVRRNCQETIRRPRCIAINWMQWGDRTL